MSVIKETFEAEVILTIRSEEKLTRRQIAELALDAEMHMNKMKPMEVLNKDSGSWTIVGIRVHMHSR